MEFDALSTASSPLSSPASLSPSPPPDYFRELYPSPPASQRTSAMASPSPESLSNSCDGDERPKKKRKVSEPKPRTTEYLDLSTPHAQLNPEQQSQLDRLLDVLTKKRKIVVIAGAGISVSAGIPDFRSSEGLFKTLRGKHGLKSSGKELFDASVYQDESSTATFHAMVRELSEKTKQADPTPFHHLLATLAQEGRLLRLYSQNVDGIDTRIEPLATKVPLMKPWPKTIQVHGGLDHMVCSKCHKVSEFEPSLFKDAIPPLCKDCEEIDSVRTSHAGKRSHGIGKLRPRMVLYNEHNPDAEAIGSVTQADLRSRPDALIVAGTTLKVPGVRRIAREMCNVVRDRRDGTTIWMNNDPEPSGKDLENLWDLVVKGPCDEVAAKAAFRKWTEDPVDYNQCITVSKDDVEKAKARNTIVVSPTKSKALLDESALLTPPVQSPQFEGPAMVFKVGENKTSPTKAKKQKTFNAASKGKTIAKVLSTKPSCKTTTQGRKPGRKAKNQAATANANQLTNVFKTSKPKGTSAKAKSKPQSRGGKKDLSVSQKAMEPIPPQDIRNNSSISPMTPPAASLGKNKDDTIHPATYPRNMGNLIHISPIATN